MRFRAALGLTVAWTGIFAACSSFGTGETPVAPDAASVVEASAEAGSDAEPASAGDAGVFPPGGDFERDPDAGTSCGDWEIEHGEGTETQPGHDSSGACKVCAPIPGGPVDLVVRPATWISSPAVGTDYEVKAWIKNLGGIPNAAHLFVDTSIGDAEQPPHEGNDAPFSDWTLLTYAYRIESGDLLARPGLQASVSAGTCVAIDDFTMIVVP